MKVICRLLLRRLRIFESILFLFLRDVATRVSRDAPVYQ